MPAAAPNRKDRVIDIGCKPSLRCVSENGSHCLRHPPLQQNLARSAESLKPPGRGYQLTMIILGLILLLLGLLTGIGILWSIGIVLVIVGAVLMLLGRSGRRIGGRAHYY